MVLPRVGKDVSPEQYWNERGAAYAAGIQGVYHAHRHAMIHKLLRGVPTAGNVFVDVGCGEGVFVEWLAARGASVIGFDPCDELISLADQRLAAVGLQARIFIGGVAALKELPSRCADCLLALNVLAYCTDAEEELFYRETNRVLEEGGQLVITHSNELFDLYTLNAFTVEFHARHFGGESSRAAVASLLTHPDKPRKATFNIRENPLAYRHKLREHGFEEVQQEFANFHPVPPLLMDPAGFVDIDRRDYRGTFDWDEKDRWKLLFQCSMFGSRSVKRATGAVLNGSQGS